MNIYFQRITNAKPSIDTLCHICKLQKPNGFLFSIQFEGSDIQRTDFVCSECFKTDSMYVVEL